MAEPDIFLSYNREDAARAKQFAGAFAAEGFEVWWDATLRSGENYDEVTEAALRDARAVVVLWSEKSVVSRWVRAEATEAERVGKLVPAMIEPCKRPIMFELKQTAELSHWKGDRKDPAWQAFVADLRGLIGKEAAPEGLAVQPAGGPQQRSAIFGGMTAKAAAAGLLALVLSIGAWWWFQPAPAAAHSMTVRMAGFELLSPDLPATIPATVDAEIAAAFNADGVIGVSTAAVPAPGSGPAFALGGTIRREGDKIRVITNLTNERSGANLWTYTFDLEGNEVSKVPRRIAVDAGNVVRCGLFGASTYRNALPDAVLGDYLQFCQGHWDTNVAEGRKALIPAQRVVAAVPDFSWGWAGVAGAYWKVAGSAGDPRLAEEARASGREAADRAISIDESNSEALYIKAVLLDRFDLVGKEELFKRALASRRLDCGCERHQYGVMLTNVGRLNDAIEQLRQANDMLALYLYTPYSLADTLVIAGRPEEAASVFDATAQLAQSDGLAVRIAVYKATATGDLGVLDDPKLALSPALRTALLGGYRALASGNADAKAQAARALVALPPEQRYFSVVWLLAELGATDEALAIASRSTFRGNANPSIFWHPSMRAVLSNPGFPAVAEQLGLMKYWKTSKTKPDVCGTKDAPPFCAMI